MTPFDYFIAGAAVSLGWRFAVWLVELVGFAVGLLGALVIRRPPSDLDRFHDRVERPGSPLSTRNP